MKQTVQQVGEVMRSRFGRVLLVLMLVGALVGLTLPAQAHESTSGTVGSHGISEPGAGCEIMNGYRNINVHRPVVYAANFHSGGGNDSQYVRYWARLWNAGTGAVVTNWAYGGQKIAYDNSPAQFGQVKFSNLTTLAHLKVQIQVAWYHPTTGNVMGTDFMNVGQYKPYGYFGSSQYIPENNNLAPLSYC